MRARPAIRAVLLAALAPSGCTDRRARPEGPRGEPITVGALPSHVRARAAAM